MYSDLLEDKRKAAAVAFLSARIVINVNNYQCVLHGYHPTTSDGGEKAIIHVPGQHPTDPLLCYTALPNIQHGQSLKHTHVHVHGCRNACRQIIHGLTLFLEIRIRFVCASY